MREEFARMWQRLGSRSIEDLIDLAADDRPRWRATVDVLTIATAPTSFTDENLCCLAVARVVNLSLRTRQRDGSSQAYVLLGEMLGTYFDDYRSGVPLRQAGLRSDGEARAAPLQGPRLLCFAQMVNHWTKHVRSSIELQRRAVRGGAEQTGDLQIASYTRNDVDHAAAGGRRSARATCSATPRTRSRSRARRSSAWSSDILTTQLRLIQVLRGLTPRFSSFDGDDFDEARVRAAPGGRLRAWRSPPAGTGSASCRGASSRSITAPPSRPRRRQRPCSGRRRRFPRSPSTTSSRRSRTRRRTTPRRSKRGPSTCRRSPGTTDRCSSGPNTAPRTSSTGPPCGCRERAPAR